MARLFRWGLHTPAHVTTPPADQFRPGIAAVPSSAATSTQQWVDKLPAGEAVHMVVYDSKAG